MRQLLLSIEGIGPKTASWIVRNVMGSDDVAIIDIHILRACTGMGVFLRTFDCPVITSRLNGDLLHSRTPLTSALLCLTL
jgi:endonuclease III